MLRSRSAPRRGFQVIDPYTAGLRPGSPVDVPGDDVRLCSVDLLAPGASEPVTVQFTACRQARQFIMGLIDSGDIVAALAERVALGMPCNVVTRPRQFITQTVPVNGGAV